jgi:hypothetical protein
LFATGTVWLVQMEAPTQDVWETVKPVRAPPTPPCNCNETLFSLNGTKMPLKS